MPVFDPVKKNIKNKITTRFDLFNLLNLFILF